MATPEEMATEVVKAWISTKSSGNANYVAQELKMIYAAMIEAFYEASKPR